jgi:hypothetical protein
MFPDLFPLPPASRVLPASFGIPEPILCPACTPSTPTGSREKFSTVLSFDSQDMACYVAVDDDGHGDYSDFSVQRRGVDEESAPPGEHRWLYGEEDGQEYDDDDEGDGHGFWSRRTSVGLSATG